LRKKEKDWAQTELYMKKEKIFTATVDRSLWQRCNRVQAHVTVSERCPDVRAVRIRREQQAGKQGEQHNNNNNARMKLQTRRHIHPSIHPRNIP